MFCEPDQIETAVQNALRGIRQTGSISKTHSIVKETRTPHDNVPRTCKEILVVLWSENWFKEDRDLGTVAEELSRRGFHYKRSAISHTLLDLTREGKLSRLGEERRYRYIQKKPPLQLFKNQDHLDDERKLIQRENMGNLKQEFMK